MQIRHLRYLILVSFAALALTVGFANSASAQVGSTRYYMLMFAQQSEANVARLSHTFALFVRASGPEANPNAKMDVQTISWMPSNMKIEPLRMYPQQGANFSLADTLVWGRSFDARVTMWGPYRIKKELYDMAARRVEQLESGASQYICNDLRLREDGAVSCIHGVSDLDTTQPLLDTGYEFGNPASELVLQHFRRYILLSDESTDWLTGRLILNPNEVRFATSAAALAKRDALAASSAWRLGLITTADTAFQASGR